MKFSRTRPCPRPADTWSNRQGTTLVETMIVSGLSVVVVAGVVSIFSMVSSFTKQGFTETRMLNQGSVAIEIMSRTLNHAFRMDAAESSFAPVIASENQSIEFTVPVTSTTNQRRRFRFDPDTETLHHEVQVNGNFQEFSGDRLLGNVDDFYITNQEGILSFVIGLHVDLGVNGDKRYTLVGRALPRNL